MHQQARSTLIAAIALLGGARMAGADEKKIPADLEPRVTASVARAATWLQSKAQPDGSFRWSVEGQRDWSCWNARAADQGLTALAVLAMVRAGVPRANPVVLKAVESLRVALASSEPPPAGRDARTFTYAAGSLLWMLSELRPPGFDDAAAQAALALSRGTTPDGLWGYTLPRVRLHDGYADVLPDPPSPAPPDLSNAQFAVIGLLAADRLGVGIGDVSWAKARDGLKATVQADGAFSYRHDSGAPPFFRQARRLTTAIAATNLFVALRRLGVSREDALGNLTVGRALRWLDAHPFLDRARESPPRWAMRDLGDQSDRLPYYEMLTIERLGAFTGIERIGGVEWYRTGALTLFSLQTMSGSWPGGTAEAQFMNDVQNTVLAILFLTRALDAVPVTSPDFTTADLLGAKDAPEPRFSEALSRAARAHSLASGDERVAWQKAFVALGERSLTALVQLHSEGSPLLAPAIHGLLGALTGAAIDGVERDARSLAWTRWLVERRGRLVPSSNGATFVAAN